MSKYDYLIVGSGLFASVFAYQARQAGKKILLIEKRNHAGGNIYCEKVEGIQVHKYGAHIFHTNNNIVWNFVNSFVTFNRFVNTPLAHYRGKLYNLPFNMNTFYALWGIADPAAVEEKIEQQRKESGITNPQNLEEQAILLVGKDIYEIFIKEYTEKQWGRKCSDLPSFIIKRLPIRFTFDNNYFNDAYQGIPVGGYNILINRLLEGIEVKMETDFFDNRKHWESIAKKTVYTGKIDAFFDYCFGKLEYRSLQFETEVLNKKNYQGNAVINYTETKIPYTRIIEHKHFEFGKQPFTVITKEYPNEWTCGAEAFYPINDDKNMHIYNKYYELTQKTKNIIFGGRLADYQYYDMDKTIERAINASKKI